MIMSISNTTRRQALRTFAAVLMLVALNASAQFIFFRDTLDEGVITGFLTSYTDGEDYMLRAEELAEGGGFGEALCDGMRMPGYPIFLSIFVKLSERPAPVVRIVQILLSSSLILTFWMIISSLTRSTAAALAGASLCALWLPFYYFSPVLYAETLCIVLTSLFMLSLTGLDLRRPIRSLIMPSVLIAALTYMKPNLILLLPALLVLLARPAAEKAFRPGLRSFLAPVLIVMLLLAPWTVFVSRCQRSPVILTTHGGWNLFLGTGGGHQYSEARHQGSIPTRVWKALDLHDDDDSSGLYAAVSPSMRARADSDYRRKALERWKRQPLKLTAYGFSKVLHIFGFSLRGPRDLIIMLHFLISVSFSIMLWKRRKWRVWSLLLWSVTIIVAAQAFVFLGELRFKTVLFDLPALVVCVLGLLILVQQIFPSRSRPVIER
jgi:hypothetical protein